MVQEKGKAGQPVDPEVVALTMLYQARLELPGLLQMPDRWVAARYEGVQASFNRLQTKWRGHHLCLHDFDPFEPYDGWVEDELHRHGYVGHASYLFDGAYEAQEAYSADRPTVDQLVRRVYEAGDQYAVTQPDFWHAARAMRRTRSLFLVMHRFGRQKQGKNKHKRVRTPAGMKERMLDEFSQFRGYV